MQESHRKGVAIHPDPESCVASREAAIEALTGAPAGRVLSCEIIVSGVPTPYHVAEGNTAARVIASLSWTLRSLRPLKNLLQSLRSSPLEMSRVLPSHSW